MLSRHISSENLLHKNNIILLGLNHCLLAELLVTIQNPTCRTSSSSCIAHLIQLQCSNNEHDEEFCTGRQSLLIAIPYLVEI